MKGIVGKSITAQLVGASGPVDLGVFDECSATPAPEVNERKLMNGETESETTGMGPWTLSFKRAKRNAAVDDLMDLAADPDTAPSLQFLETITYRDATIRQYLYTGITIRGGGTTSSAAVDESLELAADKRVKVA